jgi:outer membrane protein assembly factor BamB
VLYLPNSLRLLDLSNGAETGRIEIALVRDLVSVDAADRIWGFAERDGKLGLCGVFLDGKSERFALSSNALPSQPPIAMPDGRIAIARKNGLEVWSRGQVIWTKTFGCDNLFVIGTPRGELLARVGGSIVLFDLEGKEKWSVTSPDSQAITSNPVITSEGQVCFATGSRLQCIVQATENP